MFTKNNIVTVHGKFTVDYRNCSIVIETLNNRMLIEAKMFSRDYGIVDESVVVDESNNYHNIVDMLNHNKQAIVGLVDKLQKKAKVFDDKVVYMGGV